MSTNGTVKRLYAKRAHWSIREKRAKGHQWTKDRFAVVEAIDTMRTIYAVASSLVSIVKIDAKTTSKRASRFAVDKDRSTHE